VVKTQKAFLSHSKYDKGYVETIVKKLGPNRCIYDELTFEEGMKTIEEIDKGLQQSDIFVIFLSNWALKSSWVKTELEKAHKLLNEGEIKRIFPILIDQNINYKDERIPNWMREEYVLRLISRSVIASRRILQKMRELNWKFYPKIHEREEIFVGRNDLVNQFEERIDSIDEPLPVSLFAMGFNTIGRRSLLRYCLKKSNIVDKTYYPPLIYLNTRDGIEDFIIKLYDIGISEEMDIKGLMTKTVDEKIKIALKLVEDFIKFKEIPFIIDQGCIISPAGTINTWFKKILDEIMEINQIVFGIASNYRINPYFTLDLKCIHATSVPELNKEERKGLLKRYSNFQKLDLSNDDLRFFLGLLQGFPEQIFYVVHLIKDVGLYGAKKSTESIVDFNSEKVTALVSRYEKEESSNFLFFLSKFDFISLDFIFEIVGDKKLYKELLIDFTKSAICEFLGSNNDYIRVSDPVRNYLSRLKIHLPKVYEEKLKIHLKNFLDSYESEEKDASDLLYSIKEALKNGKEINQEYLIPSHFLRTMIDLYHNRKWDSVIILADRVLNNEEFMDVSVLRSVRFYFCLALAKKGDRRLLKEVQEIRGPDHDFILGHYYRLKGNYPKAIERLLKALKARPEFNGPKRELVIIYQIIGEDDKSKNFAKELYEANRQNPHHLQAYFTSIIKGENTPENEKNPKSSNLTHQKQKLE